ncbi:MAG: flavin reductase family protein [Candidatus Nanopelagicaceae bacterium]|jgi:flavin reductase (DIM6/NTAB) family NADH-FMN oxidoreductase RutF
MASPAINPRSFRSLMSGWITGISIVTAEVDGERVGIVCNSLTSVSLDPILVSWCVDKKISSYPLWRRAKNWAVHFVEAGQEDLVKRFTGPSADRFVDIEVIGPSAEHPALALACAKTYFTARTTAQHEAGDHVIIVGEVLSFTDGITQPLTFFRGKFLPGPTV